MAWLRRVYRNWLVYQCPLFKNYAVILEEGQTFTKQFLSLPVTQIQENAGMLSFTPFCGRFLAG